MTEYPPLSQHRSDRETSRALESLTTACKTAQTNADDGLESDHGATRGSHGYVGHEYRLHEVEVLPPDALPGFTVQTSTSRIQVFRDGLRIFVVGLGRRPSSNPYAWMPRNQEGWSPTEQRQQMLGGSREKNPFDPNVIFVCALLDTEGQLESVELRQPRIDENGQLFAWSEIEELWSRTPETDDAEEEQCDGVELEFPPEDEDQAAEEDQEGQHSDESSEQE